MRRPAAKARQLTAGEWWPKDYAGPPLVSFVDEVAEGLGLKIGDDVTVNVLGRDVTAKIANLRKVNWRSLDINFLMVFSPNTLQSGAASDHRHRRDGRAAMKRSS